MSRAASLVFWIGAVICGALFLMVTFTKLTAGQWLGYLVMFAFGIGCAACVVAARRPARERQDA